MTLVPSVVERAAALEGLFRRHSRESLERFAGMAEHPGDTLRRLQDSGDWERFAGKWFSDELRVACANKGVKDPEREAWEQLQRKLVPPAEAVACPTNAELRRMDQEKARVIEGRKASKAEERGTRPPKLSEEERRRFRELDAEVVGGRRRRDPLEDLQWVYDHIDDDEVTALDAPSRGAWSSLFFARHNRVKFFDSTWPSASKELMKRSAGVKVGTVSEGEEKTREEIRRMIREAVSHAVKGGESTTDGGRHSADDDEL